MNFIKFMLFLSIFLFFVGCEQRDNEDKKDEEIITSQSSVKTHSDSFALQLMDGTSLNIQKTNNGFRVDNNASLNVFTFFATWCQPCKVEVPVINNLSEKFKDKINFYGILTQDSVGLDKLSEFAKNSGVKYGLAYGEENNRFVEAVGGIYGMPYMIIYNSKGEFVAKFLGLMPEEILNTELERMLL